MKISEVKKNITKYTKMLEKIRKEEIKQNNKKFNSLAPPAKRVALAKDVILQIKAKRFTVKHGVWLELDNDYFSDYGREYRNISIKEEFNKNKEITCNGCAVGSLMLSATLFNNKTTAKDLYDEDFFNNIRRGEKMPNGLNTIFSREQLIKIELAFEGGTGGFTAEYTSSDDYAKCINFYNRYAIAENRLIAIMNNIIKNKGEFKP